MNNNQEVCENCGNSERRHVGEHKWCEAEWFIDGGRWKPKPTPDPKVEQVAQRPQSIGTICPRCNGTKTVESQGFSAKNIILTCGVCRGKGFLLPSQEDLVAKIAELKKELELEHSKLESIKATNLWMQQELRVTRRALEMVYESECITSWEIDKYLEAARKEQG